MAPKSILFLLAFVLVVTNMGSSAEEFRVLTEAPVYAPMTAPTAAPTSPLPEGFGMACTAMCFVRCKPMKNRPFRPCQRACTACCLKSRCVPNFSTCGCDWTTFTVRGNTFKCP